MYVVLQFLGRGVPPHGITRILGGEPHEGCMNGDIIEVSELDGTTIRKPAHVGFWRRTVMVPDGACGGDVLAAVFEGMSTDSLRWRQRCSVHRADVQICDAPGDFTVEMLFSPEDVDLVSKRGLRINAYRHPSS